MPFNHTISAILRGRWLIDKQWADAHFPMVISMLNGNPVSFIERSGNEQNEVAFAIDPKTMIRYEAFTYNPYTETWVPNANIPENSVGIIPLSGPITKYNGNCGIPGSVQRNSWLVDFKKRQNIGSVVMLMDTPGGEARAASGSVSAIKNLGKPILGYVDGMCASLGVWNLCACDEAYMSDELDEVGSIGSYCSFYDFRGYMEKEGIKLHEIYAPQSTDKNKDFRDALNGDYTAIEADLKLHVDKFISYVKDSRGGKAASSVEKWNSGKLFYAKDAVKMGLADGIKPFDQVVQKAAWLAKRKN